MSSGTKGGTKKCRNSNKNKGDCAEELLEKHYKSEGYEPLDTQSLMNKQGNGIDHAFVNKKTGELIFIETKGTSNPNSNRIPLSKLQKEGGKEYIRNRIEAMLNGFYEGAGPWTKYKHNKKFKKKIRKLLKAQQRAKSTSYKKCRVWVAQDNSGCYGQSSPTGEKPATGICEPHPDKKEPNCIDWPSEVNPAFE